MPPGSWGRVNVPEIIGRLLDHHSVVSVAKTDVAAGGVMFNFDPDKEAHITHMQIETDRGHRWEIPLPEHHQMTVRANKRVSFWFPFQGVDLPSRG